jgi:hypothetical protein
MNVVLLRVGIDPRSGGSYGPLFSDGTFEYIATPDNLGLEPHTYGNTVGWRGRPLAAYFPLSHREDLAGQSMRVNPEFDTFTYGDPASARANLHRLEAGDILAFYCGLQGWDFHSEAALYLIGYFQVATAGKASSFSEKEIQDFFFYNYYVRHKVVYKKRRDRLVLVKGGPGSRLLERAVPISVMGRDRSGRSLKVLSPKMQEVFGDFDGKISIQGSAPRWVYPGYVQRAAAFVRSLD